MTGRYRSFKHGLPGLVALRSLEHWILSPSSCPDRTQQIRVRFVKDQTEARKQATERVGHAKSALSRPFQSLLVSAGCMQADTPDRSAPEEHVTDAQLRRLKQSRASSADEIVPFSLH